MITKFSICFYCWSYNDGWQLTLCIGFWQVICTKVRDGDKRIVRLKEGEPRGRHVVIVDDLVQSGGTLIECQKLLTSQVGRQHTHAAARAGLLLLLSSWLR